MRIGLQHNDSEGFGARHPWPARMVLLATGALVPFLFAPFSFWPLALILPVIFWQLTAAVNPLQAWWHGWWFGAGFFGTGVSWVFFSMRAVQTPIAISLLLSVLFCLSLAFLFAVQAWLGTQRRGLPAFAILPLLWLLFEFIRSTLFTGLPWLLWGTASSNLWLAGWLPILGVFGVSYLGLISAGLLWRWLQQPTDRRFAAATLTLMVLSTAGGWGLQQIEWTQAETRTALSVSLIQGNVAQDGKWDPVTLRQDFQRYQDLSEQHPGATLLVWPETAIAAFPEQLQPELSEWDARLRQRQQGLIAGMPVWGENGRFYNAVRGLGTASGEYRKQHLVPFGEYLPFATLLQGVTAFFDLPMSGFSAGSAAQPMLRIEQDQQIWQLGTLICYEVAYPWLARQQAAQADALVVVSNDAWFGRSWAPAQHLQISQIRAIENQRAMIRATQNGISAFIAPNGVIVAQTEQFIATTLSGEVTARSGLTPYQRWGEWPLALLVFSFLATVLGYARWSKSPRR